MGCCISQKNAQLYICTSFEWGRCHFTYTQPLIYIETLRWVGATSNWAGKQKVTWRGSNRHRRLGKLRQGPFPQSPAVVIHGTLRTEAKQDHCLWCGILDLQDDLMTLMEVFTENPKKEALCGSGYGVPSDKDREIPLRESGRESLSRLGIWGMQRTCYSNVTSESATAESLHCWRRCGVLVCDFKVSWPESTRLMAWSRWAFIEKKFQGGLK